MRYISSGASDIGGGETRRRAARPAAAVRGGLAGIRPTYTGVPSTLLDFTQSRP